MATPTDTARPRTSPFWWVLGTIGVVLGVAWCAWVAWDDVPPFQTQVYAFDVKGDDAVTLTFDVYRDEPVALECEVYAQSVDKNIVSERIVQIESSSEERVRVTVDLTTSQRATTAAVRACSIV